MAQYMLQIFPEALKGIKQRIIEKRKKNRRLVCTRQTITDEGQLHKSINNASD